MYENSSVSLKNYMEMILKCENIIIHYFFCENHFCINLLWFITQAQEWAEFNSNIGERTYESEKLLYEHGVLNRRFDYQRTYESVKLLYGHGVLNKGLDYRVNM